MQNTDNAHTIIDLLRHGEVQGGPCYRGAKDDPLTKKGWQQLAQATQGKKWDTIISSPLCRCADFSRHLSKKSIISENLKEIDFGDWEGKTAKSLFEHSPEYLKKFMLDPENNPPPNGEKLSLFRQRIIDEWKAIIEKHQSQHILIISHGGTMRAIISHVLNIPPKDMMRLEVPHASMSRVNIYHKGNVTYPSLSFHGNVYQATEATHE